MASMLAKIRSGEVKARHFAAILQRLAGRESQANTSDVSHECRAKRVAGHPELPHFALFLG